VASSVICVAAQRLGKKLCVDCKAPLDVKPPAEHLLSLGFKEDELDDLVLHQPIGCPRCDGKGYKGRFAILETLPVNDALRRVIIKGGSALDIKAEGLRQDMLTLRRCGLMNVMRGRTSLEEALRVTMGDD